MTTTKPTTKEVEIKDRRYSLEKIGDMTNMAMVLKTHIVRNNLYTKIINKNYAHVEGWQFAGGLMGLYPRVSRVENLSTNTEFRWKADVEIIDLKTGDVVSNGFAICSNKENRKKSFDEYAVLSMAQTRAIGKAYRNLIGWVMKLAGMEGTPSEEMTKMGDTPKEPSETVYSPETGQTSPTGRNLPNQPMKKGQVMGPDGDPVYVCSATGDIISEQEYQYSTRIYGRALSKESQQGAKRRK